MYKLLSYMCSLILYTKYLDRTSCDLTIHNISNNLYYLTFIPIGIPFFYLELGYSEFITHVTL